MFKRLGIVLFATALILFAMNRFVGVSRPQYHEVNPERKATHLITFVEVNEETGEQKILQTCTGTAVGPEALLTAEHCLEGANTTIELDLSPVIYRVNNVVADGRDHVILHVIDANFKNVIHIKERNAVLGERVRVYGNGGNDYPSHAYHGIVIKDGYEGDLSDIDESVGVANYSLPVVGGDSGSAVYGDDGAIIGLVSLGRGGDKESYEYATGFSLAFSPQVLEIIQ